MQPATAAHAPCRPAPVAVLRPRVLGAPARTLQQSTTAQKLLAITRRTWGL